MTKHTHRNVTRINIPKTLERTERTGMLLLQNSCWISITCKWMQRGWHLSLFASKVIIHKSRGEQSLWNRNWDLWAFHPILVTWFLVVFGDEVTKILRNSLFTFLLSKARQAKQKFKVKKNHATKMTKKPKTKLPKFVMSRALVDLITKVALSP